MATKKNHYSHFRTGENPPQALIKTTKMEEKMARASDKLIEQLKQEIFQRIAEAG